MIVNSTNMLVGVDNVHSNVINTKGHLEMEIKGHLLLGSFGIAALKMKGDSSLPNIIVWFKAEITHGHMYDTSGGNGIVNAGSGIWTHRIKGCVVSKGAVGKLNTDSVVISGIGMSIWYGINMSSKPFGAHTLLDPN